MISTLDDFNEYSGTIFKWLGKYLKQIALLVEVHQNVQFPNDFQVFLDLSAGFAEPLGQVIVVCRWDRQELAPSIFHASHGVDNTVGSQGDVLDASASVVIDVLLDLGLPLARRWLVDWHLDVLIKIADDD